MRWLLGQFQHETNTFSNIHPGREEFAERDFHVGGDIVDYYRGTRTVVGAFIDFVRDSRIDPVWTVSAFATPAGVVRGEFYRWMTAQILEAATPRIDGVLLALHGAMVAEGVDDGEGALLAELRKRLGGTRPIAVTLDYHTNLSAAMLENADILVGYKTYPHVDTYETGIAAAELLWRCVNREIRPVRAAQYPPILAPLGNTSTLDEPMKSMIESARELERQKGVLSASVFGGFAWSDIADAGMSTLVITHDDPLSGAEHAKRLADSLWENRYSFIARAVPIPEAVRQAVDSMEHPVVLVDVADNPGGGGAGDGVEILRELLAKGAAEAVVGTIWDPVAVETCRRAGAGAIVKLDLGAKTDRLHGSPVTLTATVVRLGDGQWTYEGPMNKGLRSSMGSTAVIRAGGVEIVVASRRIQNLDLAILRSNGIEPTSRRILVVKSSIHYRGAYGPIAKRLIDVDAPGLVSPNLKRFDFRRIRRPIFPLDPM